MPATETRPNLFELAGEATQITYSTSSLAGPPQFTYSHEGQKRSFSGGAIRVEDSPLGRLVTVTLESIPDFRTQELSFLLPGFNFEGEAVAFDTCAVLSTAFSNIAGPGGVHGALSSFSAVNLKGTARRVEF